MLGKLRRLVLVGALGLGLAACRAPVAATVNGVAISEDEVTRHAMLMRDAVPDYRDDAAWATALASFAQTPEGLREAIIEEMVGMEVIRQEAVKLGLRADPGYIAAQVAEQRRASTVATDEQWLGLLNAWGYADEDDFRYRLENTALRQMLANRLFPQTEVDAAQLDEYMLAHASEYTGKRSSVILLEPGPGESDADLLSRAGEIHGRLLNGGDFASLADEYPQSALAVGPGGDVGWDSLNGQLDEGYRAALANLRVGEASEPVRTSQGVCIILCTEEFAWPEDGTGDLSAVPEDVAAALSRRLAAELQDAEINAWLAERRSQAEVTISPMPKGLPYDVDMSLAGEW